MHLAAFFGHAEVANALLDRGADVNACSTGHQDIARLLEELGAKLQ